MQSYGFVDPYPEACERECHCYFKGGRNAFVADCSNSGLTEIPQSLPNSLDWLILAANKISTISNFTSISNILQHITTLDLKQNSIGVIPNEFLENFVISSKLVFLDISKNNLTSLPKIMKNITSLNEIWISGNPYKCECDNMWMKTWILNNSNVIKDYKNAYCQNASGKIDIIHMSEIDVGCVAKDKYEFPTWQITGKQLFNRLIWAACKF